MKTLFKTALCASIFASTALSTPALAQVPTDVQDEMQAFCEAALNPDDASQFQTEPTGVSSVTGPEFLSDSQVLSSTPAGVLLSQTSVFAGNATRHRHGGSPNIFGSFTITSVYSGGTSETLNTYSQTTTYTYGCHTFKEAGNGNLIEPPGLQIPVGLTVEDTNVTRTETVTVNNPNTTVVTTGDGVICISPNKNPGTWRNQNGYTGECSTALFNSLPGIEPISSNSQPPV